MKSDAVKQCLEPQHVAADDLEGVAAGSSPIDPAGHDMAARELLPSQTGENPERFLSLKTGTVRCLDNW